MPLLIIVELADAAPMKTLTSMQTMEGVIAVHMNLERSAAEIKRLLRDAPTREEAAPAKRNSVSQHDLIMLHLVKHGNAGYQDIGRVIMESGGAAGSAGAALNKMKGEGEVANHPVHGWSLTAKGRKVAGALFGAPVKAKPKAKPKTKSKANGDGRRNKAEREVFGNAEVIAMLQRSNKQTQTLDHIAEAFEKHGKNRDMARGTIERLKGKKLVTTAITAEGVRTVTLREKANAAS